MTAWRFDNSYKSLSPALFAPVAPTPVADPRLVVLNRPLAKALGLEIEAGQEAQWAAIFAGNAVPEGASPIAQAYAGHQFGHFTMLGDGRAILMGEQQTPQGERFDIQWKGPGQTPYSRRGDGRATLSAMLREYLISEAMHHLGIPTTRSLAVATTGEKVYRENIHNGAVLTRVARSHIRVGTFEYVRHFLPETEWRPFLDYVIQRHYPELIGTEQPAAALLKQVMLRQIDLIVHWMRVGFIHGVMNTDNMSIAGETIDYGPCAFMDAYGPQTVFSSIDTYGRYAYGNQPVIAHWNLAVFGSALLPLIAPQQEEAVAIAQDILNEFPDRYTGQWLAMMASKLGISNPMPEDEPLVKELLQLMERYQADYTNTFLTLGGDWAPDHELFATPAFAAWRQRWSDRIAATPEGKPGAEQLMRRQNPAFIPRNHLVEAALAAAAQQNDLSKFNDLLRVLSDPYERRTTDKGYQVLPEINPNYRTFCGT